MRVQLTLSTPTTRWNCMFTYSKGLTWNALKFSKIYLLTADHSFQTYCSVCIVFIVSICVSFLYICLTSETLHYPWIPSYICQNGALMLWTILYYKILFQWLICKFSSVILKLIVTRDVKFVLHEYLKFKKDFFVFYIDFYFGYLLVIGVYKFQTKISKVPMVRFLIFFQKYIKWKCCKMFYKRDLRDALTIFGIFSIEVTLVNFEKWIPNRLERQSTTKK